MKKSVADWAWFLMAFTCILVSLCPFFVSYICCHSIYFPKCTWRVCVKLEFLSHQVFFFFFSGSVLTRPSILTSHCCSHDAYKLAWLYSEWSGIQRLMELYYAYTLWSTLLLARILPLEMSKSLHFPHTLCTPRIVWYLFTHFWKRWTMEDEQWRMVGSCYYYHHVF